MAFAFSETGSEIRIALGSVLRSRRAATGRTLSEVAAEAGLSPAHLSEVERGRKEVSTEKLLAVARALNVRAAEITVQALSRPLPDRCADGPIPGLSRVTRTVTVPTSAIVSVDTPSNRQVVKTPQFTLTG